MSEEFSLTSPVPVGGRESHTLVCMLLRLSFLEPTKSRRDLLTAYRPDVLILPRRPVFDGRGTDSITSAWFCWPGEGRIIWLPEAP